MGKRWGYKGTATAINGLYNWLLHNTTIKSTDLPFCIIRYGESNIPGFKMQGKPDQCADFIAKKIQRNNKFKHFTDWVFRNFETTN